MTDPAEHDTAPAAATAVAADAAAAPERKKSSIGRSSAILASGTIVSRVFGFISAAALAWAIGTEGQGANAFTLANQLPNNIYSLVAGGLLSAVLVPSIVKAGLHADGGNAFINKLITIGIVVFLPLSVLATLAAPFFATVYGARNGGDEYFELTTAFAYWCLPQIFFYALYSLVGETLNARGVFGPFTWAPVLNNLVAISGIVVFVTVFGSDPAHRSASSWTPAEIALLAGSATLGIAVQAFGLFFFWKKAGLKFGLDFRWKGVGLANTGRAASWVFGIFLVSQIAGVVETQVANRAAEEGASVAAMKYAWLMFMLPHSVATVSIVTAYFTRMSEHVRDAKIAAVRDDMVSALKTVLMIMVFALVGLAVLAYPFSAVFARGSEATYNLGNVYLANLTGLIPFTIFFVLLRIYYALDATRTAFAIQVVQSVFYVAAALTINVLVPLEWLAASLALALSVAMTIQAVLSGVFLRSRLGNLGTKEVTLRGLWYLGAAVPAGAVGFGIVQLLGGVTPGAFPISGPLGGIVTMAIAGAIMAVVYFALLWFTRNPELRDFAGPILRRVTRR